MPGQAGGKVVATAAARAAADMKVPRRVTSTRGVVNPLEED